MTYLLVIQFREPHRGSQLLRKEHVHFKPGWQARNEVSSPAGLFMQVLSGCHVGVANSAMKLVANSAMKF
jgi:hypothetical protein